MPCLKINQPGQTGDLFMPLPTEGEFTVGRGSSNSLALADAKVSRRHLLIAADGRDFYAEDCGSSHGCSLNGQPLSERRKLKFDDAIILGDTTLLFLPDQAATATTPATATATTPAATPAAPPPPGASTPPAMPATAAQTAEPAPAQVRNLLFSDEMVTLKKTIHESILHKMNLQELASKELADNEMRSKLMAAMETVLREVRHQIPAGMDLQELRQLLLDELVGFGPISTLLRDDSVSEIMVNGPRQIFIERSGRLVESGIVFYDHRHLMNIIQRIVEPLGRHVDEASPMVDARLPDGSRVNAIIPPLALDGASLTIRKFSKKKLTDADLIRYGTLTPEMALFLNEAVRARQNVVVSGGTGSGKTTLLNVLSLYIPHDERVVTIEDSAELKLTHANLVRLESRPPNIEGKGRIAIRELVINALRMRPDRIVVGECRGAEALDMLQAMNTGHDGSLTTLHANTPRDAVMRLENMVMMAGYDLPSSAIREQIASAVNLIVQQTRMLDGSRKIIQISEVTGREGDVVCMQDIFKYDQTGIDANGKLQGRFAATGNIPRFVEILRQKGDLRLPLDLFRTQI